MIMFLKIGKKDCHFKNDTAMCDSFEIDYIEKAFLHAHLNTFYYKKVPLKCEKLFLKVEYLESLLGLVLKKIHRTVF